MSKITITRSHVRLELDTEAFDELRKRDEVVSFCESKMSSIRSSLGEGYEVQKRTYPDRAGAAIVVASNEAYRDNLENNTLLKAVGKS